MARKGTGVRLPSGQGGLVGGFSTSYKSKISFSPKLVIVFSLLVVIFIWILFVSS
mgnify:CR=1